MLLCHGRAGVSANAPAVSGAPSATALQNGATDEGLIAKLFAVTAIPATFTIDADGVLQDQHVGDADIEGKIKKLVARASEVENRKTVAEVR